MARPTLRNRIFLIIRHLDYAILLPALAISAFSVVMVYSVTKPSAFLLGVSPHSYMVKQLVFFIGGFIAFIVVISLDYRFFENLSYIIYTVILLALIAVLETRAHLGSSRWFQVGPIQIQPSEFAIVAIILVFSRYFSDKDTLGLRHLLVSVAMVGIYEVLIFKQPDLGTAIVVGVVAVVLWISSGIKGRHILLLSLMGAGAVFLVLNLGILHKYQTARLGVFLHPGSAPPNQIYNLQQSEYAIGSGGLLGTGYLKGPQTNLSYVPEAQTDFIFSAVGEQFGFLGSVALLGLYLIIISRIIRAISLARDRFGSLICAGALALFGFEVFENAGMTMGIMPVAGIPLPMMSYGGSGMMIFWVIIGLVESVEARRFILKKSGNKLRWI